MGNTNKPKSKPTKLIDLLHPPPYIVIQHDELFNNINKELITSANITGILSNFKEKQINFYEQEYKKFQKFIVKHIDKRLQNNKYSYSGIIIYKYTRKLFITGIPKKYVDDALNKLYLFKTADFIIKSYPGCKTNFIIDLNALKITYTIALFNKF